MADTTPLPPHQVPAHLDDQSSTHMTAQFPQLATHVSQANVLGFGFTHNVAPPVTFWEKFSKVQAAAPSMEKAAEMPAKGRRAPVSFSKTEDTIRAVKPLFLQHGLVFTAHMVRQQVDERTPGPGVVPAGPDGSVVGIVVEVASGLGCYWTMDRPTTGATNGMSPSHERTGAFTDGIKQLLRGILMLDQHEPDEVERDGTINNPKVMREPGAPPPPPPTRQAPPPQQQAPQQQAPQQQPPINNEPIVTTSQQVLDSQRVSTAEAGMDVPHQQNEPSLPPPPPPPTTPLRTQGPSAGALPPMDAPPDLVDTASSNHLLTAESLQSRGWSQQDALQIASIPDDDNVVNKDLAMFAMQKTQEAFQGNLAASQSLWEGTGFTPQPGSGKLPTGKQLRLYLAKITWPAPQAR